MRQTTTVGVGAVVNERSWRLVLWRGRRSVQWGVPASAALTRTSLSIPLDLRGRSAGLRRGSPLCRLTGPVTRGLMLGWLGAGLLWWWRWWVGVDMPRGQLQQGQRLHSDKSPQHPNEESRLACLEDWGNEHGLDARLFVCVWVYLTYPRRIRFLRSCCYHACLTSLTDAFLSWCFPLVEQKQTTTQTGNQYALRELCSCGYVSLETKSRCKLLMKWNLLNIRPLVRNCCTLEDFL